MVVRYFYREPVSINAQTNLFWESRNNLVISQFAMTRQINMVNVPSTEWGGIWTEKS